MEVAIRISPDDPLHKPLTEIAYSIEKDDRFIFMQVFNSHLLMLLVCEEQLVEFLDFAYR